MVVAALMAGRFSIVGLVTMAFVGVAAADTASSSVSANAFTQQLGAQVGAVTGGTTTPGGVGVAGHYSYRLSSKDWIVVGADFVFGRQQSACGMAVDSGLDCDHGLASGFAAGLDVGVRRYLASQGSFVPYVQGGFAVHVARFRADELTGLAIPVVVGGGIRASASDVVGIFAGAQLRVGPSWYNRGLGSRAYASMLVAAGVEFAVD